LRTRAVAAATPLLLLAAAVAPASGATPTATATLAPIGAGSGSYLVTVKNTGSDTIENYSVITGAGPTSVAPPACRVGPVSGMFCAIPIVAGGESQMCYSGPAATALWLNFGHYTPVTLTMAAAVSSCPVAGFTPTGGGSIGGGTTTKCVVPKVANKTLAAAEKALTKAHCKVGKIKQAKSRHVKKGRVISSSPTVGKSYAGGYKVNLVVSRRK
jgi:hypothetical protein